MRYVTCLFLALYLCVSVLGAAEPQNRQPATSEVQPVNKPGTQNSEANALYLKGRSYWEKRTLPDLETAVSYFNQAIAKDPLYAQAYEGLADAYAVLPDYGGSPSEDIPKSNAAARKALELDPTLGRPHAALGYTKFVHDWDFAGGESEFKKALALDPYDATAHAWYAENIGQIGGREEEALAEINRAHQLDPRSIIITHDLGTNLIYARRYDDAIAVCKKLVDENPTFALAHNCLSEAYWGKRTYSQSLEEYKLGCQLSDDRDGSEVSSAMKQGFDSGGWDGALRKGIEVLLAQRKTNNSSSAYSVAEMYADLRDKDQAFQWLNTALQDHDPGLQAVKTDFALDSLRADPRFAELVRKVGLPSEEKQVSKQGTQNPEAYELYLKGRSYWARRTRADLETAVSYFNQAIAKDPGYAMAYAGLADCYAMLPVYGASAEDIPKAKAAALKAIELDPTLSRPHVNLGGMKMAHWDFAGGEAAFKKALELDPNDAHAHQRYADNLNLLGGREQDALAEINRAHQLDPGSLAISVDVGNVYASARRFDEAIAVCKKVANENPTFADAHSCLANAYWGKRMYPQVIEEWTAYGKLTGEQSDFDYAAALAQGFRSGDWKGALSKSIETLKAQRKTGQPSAYFIADAYAELGEKDQAFQWLNTAFQEHEEYLMGLKTDFTLDSLRSDPRFADLVRKVGLPQASGQGTQNPEAYELYLKGRSYLDKQNLPDLRTAVSYFNEAIAKDPGYALAYSGLARVYAILPDYGDSPVEDHPKAMAAARKALELDPSLSESHLVLGGQMMYQDWNIAGGVAEFKKAVELDPDNARVHSRYALNISIVGGMEQEALAEANRARQLDPQSKEISYVLGFVHNCARQFDQGIAVCKKLASENPTYADAHDCLANAYWAKHMYPQAIEEFKVEGQASSDQNLSEYASALERGFRSAGFEGALRQSIETLKAQRKFNLCDHLRFRIPDCWCLCRVGRQRSGIPVAQHCASRTR